MGLQFEIEVDLSGLTSLLKDMVDAAETTRINEFLEGKVADELRKSFDEQFSRGGFPDRWEALADSTVAQKKGAGYPRRNRNGGIPKATVQNGMFGPENILIRKGDLRTSWTKKHGVAHVSEATNGQLEIGSELDYAIFHQSDEPRKISSKTGKAKLPHRPLVITDEAMGRIVEITIDHFLGVKNE